MKPLILLILFAAALAPACAHQAGQEAAAGAVAGLREEEVSRLAGKAGHRLVAGILDELAKKEQQQRIREITHAAVSGALEGATGVPPGPWVGPQGLGGAGVAPPGTGGLGATGGAARGPAGLVAQQVGRRLVDAAAARLEQHLGGGGKGPLATSLAATFQGISSSVVRGAADEAARAFPECQGKDNQLGCVQQHVEQLARATGKHVAQGIVEGIGVWPFIVAFALGILVTGLLVWAIAVTLSLRRLQATLRERESRP